MKKFFESALAVWATASPTKRRWIIMGGGVLLGIIVALLLF